RRRLRHAGPRPPRADPRAEGQARRAPRAAPGIPAALQREGPEGLRAEPREDPGGPRQGQQGIAGEPSEDAGIAVAAPGRVRVSRLDLAVPAETGRSTGGPALTGDSREPG